MKALISIAKAVLCGILLPFWLVFCVLFSFYAGFLWILGSWGLIVKRPFSFKTRFEPDRTEQVKPSFNPADMMKNVPWAQNISNTTVNNVTNNTTINNVTNNTDSHDQNTVNNYYYMGGQPPQTPPSANPPLPQDTRPTRIYDASNPHPLPQSEPTKEIGDSSSDPAGLPSLPEMKKEGSDK